MDTTELEKSKVHRIVETIGYVPNARASKNIIKKLTGSISVSSFGEGERLAENRCPFDYYILVIDGTTEIVIDDLKYKLASGDGITIPAHVTHYFNVREHFKMISVIIKSGYEG